MSARQPLTYLSFAGDEGFRGALILDGELDPKAAIQTAWAKRLNPGGQVLVIIVPPDCPEADYQAMLARRDRLLSREEAEAMQEGKTAGELADEGYPLDQMFDDCRIEEDENQ